MSVMRLILACLSLKAHASQLAYVSKNQLSEGSSEVLASLLLAFNPVRTSIRTPFGGAVLERAEAPHMGLPAGAKLIKLALQAGKATPAPPIGPALGAAGVNIMMFCKQYNAATADKAGEIIPVDIVVLADKSFTFTLKTPPTSFLLKKAAGVEKGTGNPGGRQKKIVGKVTEAQVEEIAKLKMPDLNTRDLEMAKNSIRGSARSAGIEVVAA
mmetsp:Transcript_76221/g.120026  ORF Transcript_76221/g.120026 Transcript_76221/m.120026 type:complete len:213 (-) Transcript_76221:125-763(-)